MSTPVDSSAKWTPPGWSRFVPTFQWGLEHAKDGDEALRTWVLDIHATILFLIPGLLTLSHLRHGAWLPAAVQSTGPLLGGLVLALNRQGRLHLARTLTLYLNPLTAFVVVGSGLARQGDFVQFLVIALLPMVLLEQPAGRDWTRHGVMVGSLGGLATWFGMAHPLLSGGSPIVGATIAAVSGSVGVTLLARITSVRQARYRARIEAALRDQKRAEETREHLLATVSHELRTPASMALGLLDDAVGFELEPSVRPLVEKARDMIALELDVVSDLLDVVALKKDNLPLRPRPVELGAILERCLFPASDRARTRGVRFEVPAAKLGYRALDPDRLGQIARHLALNAVTHARSRVIIELDTKEEAHVVLRVRDDGRGLPPERLAFLSEAFSQADLSHARQHQGLGLGLTLVTALVRLMGGRLEVRADEGTLFEVLLPAPRAKNPNEAGRLDGWRVLVVDDIALNRKLLRRVVERMGAIEVYEACDGAEAVSEWSAHTPDLVLMDMQMPDVDGPEATRRIRALGGKTPIVAVTANITPEAEQTCVEAGMDAYLTKPVRVADLSRTTERWLAPTPG